MKKKINMHFIMVSSLAVLVLAAVSMILFYNILKNQVYDDIEAYTHVIQPFQPEFWETEENRERLAQDGLRITLILKGGSVSYDSRVNRQEMENHRNRPEIRDALERGKGRAVRWSVTSSLHTLYYAERLENGDVLRVGKDSENFFRILEHTSVLVTILAAVIVVICGTISHYLTRNLLRPIEKLASDLEGPGQEDVYEEIRPFILTIREQHLNMLNHARMRQEFTANVSHELKTPLTAISGYAELIENGMADDKDVRRFAGEIHSGADRLLWLINDILKLSELDDTEQESEFEQMDLYRAARDCLALMEVQAAKQGITLGLQGKSCMITANRNLIEELLYNLCSNALRYNQRGGKVTVTADTENGRVFLSVKDTGIGIPREHQERIFERFYRVDKSRSRQNGGTGLGLAIVKHIVAQHSAEIMLESEPGKGTEIRVLF